LNLQSADPISALLAINVIKNTRTPKHAKMDALLDAVSLAIWLRRWK